ncbi:uncharacterized protein LOC125559010 [Nematostella vectensis]|uniref:uncharacterized protein LOC125559010 n=1 Tax=Nematostella vectensis TaxID=45351 RepID=UPI002077381E|nr:uncharacterized protein LOC125559010 [Nematostella vectensis]
MYNAENTRSKGASKHCAWGVCKSDSRYPEKLPEGTNFIRFPKPGNVKDGMTEWEKGQQILKTEKAKRWLHACGRKDFSKISDIKKDTYICTLHFMEGKGPTEDHPYPVLATLTEKEQNQRATRAKTRSRSRKRRENPIEETGASKKHQQESSCFSVPGDPEEQSEDTSVLFESGLPGPSRASLESQDQGRTDKETQTVYCKYTLGAKVETMIYRNRLIQEGIGLFPSEQKEVNLMSSEIIIADDKKCKYFTGLHTEQFEALFEFLGPAKYELSYWDGPENIEKGSLARGEPQGISVKEQLFLTLLRLRRGFNIATIAHMYSISNTVVRKIFVTWIQFMFCHFKEFEHLMFPSRQALRTFLPKVFQKFKNVRCSVDCTEFFCQTPSNYAQQGNMFSSYKHHNTMKCLIAVTPNGSACFVSDLFEGSIDDVSIFRESGILKHINPGDAILVDKRFTVQDLLFNKQATIHIPPFLGKRDCLTKEEELATKRIAKARIHVERFNERLKKFRLIGNIIPLNLSSIASQLVYVSCCLVNFQPCLCK